MKIFLLYTNWNKIKMPLLFLWTCADMTPHPVVINCSWWQDRKIFGKDFKITHWPEDYLKLRSGYFVDKKKKILFFTFDLLQLLLLSDQMFEKSYQNTWKQVHSCRWDKSTSSFFSDDFGMLCSSDIQTFFLLCRGQPLRIIQFRLTFMHQPVYRPIILPAKYFLPIGFALVCWYITALFHETQIQTLATGFDGSVENNFKPFSFVEICLNLTWQHHGTLATDQTCRTYETPALYSHLHLWPPTQGHAALARFGA